MMFRQCLVELSGKIIYTIGKIFFEFACIFFWVSGKFLNTEIDLFHEINYDYDKYVVTLYNISGGLTNETGRSN